MIKEELANKIAQEYLAGKSIKRLTKLYGKDHKTIKRILKRQNIQIKNFQHYPKYKINENFFEQIDSEAKAYFLGFLYADGYICNNKKFIRWEIQEKDKYILELFTASTHSNHPIQPRKKDKTHKQTQFEIKLYNVKIYKDLIKAGCTYLKSSRISIPNNNILPEKLIHHFIRGYFDGDGHIALQKQKKYTNYCASLQICLRLPIAKSIQSTIKNHTNIDFKLKPHSGSKEVFNLMIYNKNDVLKFYDWLYQDATLFLTRKKETFLKIKEWSENKEAWFKYKKMLKYNKRQIYLILKPYIIKSAYKKYKWN